MTELTHSPNARSRSRATDAPARNDAKLGRAGSFGFFASLASPDARRSRSVLPTGATGFGPRALAFAPSPFVVVRASRPNEPETLCACSRASSRSRASRVRLRRAWKVYESAPGRARVSETRDASAGATALPRTRTAKDIFLPRLSLPASPSPSSSVTRMSPVCACRLALEGHHATRTTCDAPGGRKTRSGSTRNPTSRGTRSKRASCTCGVSFCTRRGRVWLTPTRASSKRRHGTCSGRPRRSSAGAVSLPSAGLAAREVPPTRAAPESFEACAAARTRGTLFSLSIRGSHTSNLRSNAGGGGIVAPVPPGRAPRSPDVGGESDVPRAVVFAFGVETSRVPGAGDCHPTAASWRYRDAPSVYVRVSRGRSRLDRVASRAFGARRANGARVASDGNEKNARRGGKTERIVTRSRKARLTGPTQHFTARCHRGATAAHR